jgi:hypothetical protein
MSKNPETGHAKSLAKFDELVSFVSAYGTVYNPSNPSISLAELEKLSSEARTALANLNTALPSLSNASADREVAFLPLSRLITRAYSVLRSTKTSQQVDESARTLVRKIQGKRATPKLTEEKKAALKAEGIEKREISSSQMSFDSRLENLFKLIQLLKSIPQYSPNEEELSVAGLTSLYKDLFVKNAEVIAASIQVRNARIRRNEVLYKPDIGLIDTSFAVKAYVKGLFGANSQQYKQVSRLQFRLSKA